MLCNQERNENNIDVIYSLPAITHSVALANRTPSARFTQKSKYMPDYGGIIETIDSGLKSNDLTCKLQFESRPSGSKELILRGTTQNTKPVIPPDDCLVVIPSSFEDYFIIILAHGSNIFVNSIVENNLDNSYETSLIYTKQYSERITGIKLLHKFLAVRFSSVVKLLDLNILFKKVDETFELDVDSTITEKLGFNIRDSCINKFNNAIYGIASNHSALGQVKLYDLSTKLAAKHPFVTISCNSEEDNSFTVIDDEVDTIHKILRGRTIRQFLPSKPTTRGIQQLDNIPAHLVNMIVTTDYKVSLIDPRIDHLGQVYADKKTIPSFYPTEYLRRTLFSNYNAYQFYSLSNVHLRVFDTRYPGLPMNQLNHMLDAKTNDTLQMKLINYTDDLLETVCCSHHSRLGFITFDQANLSNLINPKSMHLPYHDDGDEFVDKQLSSFESREMYEIFGLDIHRSSSKSTSDTLFSTIQLLSSDNILIRDFSKITQKNNSDSNEERVEFIMDNTRKKFASFRSNIFQYNYKNNNDLNERDIINLKGDCELDSAYINILDSDIPLSIEDSFTSLRARERYLKMKVNFYR